MADGFVHTCTRVGRWLNEIKRGAEFGGTHSTRGTGGCGWSGPGDAARTEHLIHNEDGAIGEPSSYGKRFLRPARVERGLTRKRDESGRTIGHEAVPGDLAGPAVPLGEPPGSDEHEPDTASAWPPRASP